MFYSILFFQNNTKILGSEKFIVTNNGTIDLNAWAVLINKNITIRFYANDSFGIINYEEITVIKQSGGPEITIISPLNLESFSLPPNFTIEVSDPNLDSIWYTLNLNPQKFFITSNGTIDFNAWDLLSNGNITIRFIANDSLGNLNFAEVIVIKDIKTKNSPSPLSNILLISLLINVLSSIQFNRNNFYYP